MQCPNCQFENSPEFKFCLKCGTPLTGDTSASPEPQQQAATGNAAQEKPKSAALVCSNCGGKNFAKAKKRIGSGEDAEYVSIARCTSCDSTFDKNTPEYYKFFKNRFKPREKASPLKLGLKGTLDNVEYEILGRIRYNDEEDYEIETWDEWYMISQFGDRSWLVNEEGEFFLYKKYRPKQELSFNEQGIRFDGTSISRSKIYHARIGHTEGQLPWEATIGECVECCDFKKDGQKFCIEKSEEEIEVYVATKIDPLDLFTGFKLTQFIEMYHKSILQRKIYRKKALIYLFASLLTLVWSINNCFKGTKKMELGQNRFAAKATPLSYKKVRYGPITLDKAGSIHRFVVRCRYLRHEWVESYITLQDSKFRDVYGFTSGFWHESGYDSDGYWSESDLYDDECFVLEKKGTYYVLVEISSRRPGRGWNSVRIEIVENEKSHFYLTIAFILFFILFMLSYSKSKTASRFPFRLKV